MLIDSKVFLFPLHASLTSMSNFPLVFNISFFKLFRLSMLVISHE